MKRIALTALIALTTLAGFAQVIDKKTKTVTVKRVTQEAPVSAKIDFSDTAEPITGTVVYGRIDENGDTTLVVYLPEVDIDLMQRYLQITETNKGRRLANNVKKVYPYAKLASAKMQEYDSILANVPSEFDRHMLMKQAEKELTDQYTEELKNLTLMQGAILIRLIDRETGNTSYQVVQELRGKVRAFFYQGFARLWGYNLKSEYDPHNNPEDDEIETIVTLLERGVI
ncbi:MAG: DUF4294 domain-containing protein [Bacteroidales bacterium]|nr:DUF4294 domain-containing protein [Bacteroidales bacterium]